MSKLLNCTWVKNQMWVTFLCKRNNYLPNTMSNNIETRNVPCFVTKKLSIFRFRQLKMGKVQ